jgi:hypothetical protein
MNFVWILVLSPWVGFIVLILYDATKRDSDGGAFAVAAKNFKALIERTTLMGRRLWKAQSSTFSQASSPAVARDSSSPEPIRQPSLVGQTPAAAPKKKPRRKDGRVLATIPDLEVAITEAVRKAAPECETFAGVVLQQTKPRSRRDANWQLRGIKFGQADRKIASEALAGTIERMQRGFYIGERG